MDDTPLPAGPDDPRDWPDARLVELVRQDVPDARALQLLVERHWPALHARCALLAGDRELARELAQETWARVLRARRTLDPAGSLGGFLATVATNLWRDRLRAERRAGPLATGRLVALDAPAGDANVPLGDALPDPAALGAEGQALLRVDLERALSRLEPRARDLLLARYVEGRSAAELAREHGRSEQAVTAWLRAAAAELRRALARGDGGA